MKRSFAASFNNDERNHDLGVKRPDQIENIIKHGVKKNHITYVTYEAEDGIVYDFENPYDSMLPTRLLNHPSNDTLHVFHENSSVDRELCYARYYQQRDGNLQPHSSGNFVEVLRGPLCLLVTKHGARELKMNGKLNARTFAEKMADESYCVIPDVLDQETVGQILALCPIGEELVGPADLCAYKDIFIPGAHPSITEFVRQLANADQLRLDSVECRVMEVGCYELMQDDAHLANTVYAVLTLQADSLEIRGGVTRWLDAEGHVLISFEPTHNTMCAVYVGDEPIRVYTELVREGCCCSSFTQLVFRWSL